VGGDERAPVLEAHLLDGPPAADTGEIEVEWLRFIRPEQAFASPEELRRQIAADCETVRQLHRHG
jgi:FAD synthase